MPIIDAVSLPHTAAKVQDRLSLWTLLSGSWIEYYAMLS